MPVDHGVGHVNEFAGDDLAPVLGMAPSMATRRVRTAATLTAHLPVTLRAVAEGDLDPFRAQIVAEETLLADRDTCAAVEEVIFPRATGCTPGELRRLLRRTLDALAPEMVRAAAARARAQRFVMRQEGEIPGITQWWAHLPAEESAACWAAIETVAAQMKAEDPSRTIDQCRADALVDLILGNADVTTTLTIAVPLSCLASADGQATQRPDATGTGTQTHTETRADNQVKTDSGTPGWSPRPGAPMGCTIPGIGIIPAQALQTLLQRFDIQISRMLVDADTGATRETSSTTYRPPARLRHHVQARDGTCRFPGCRISATRCQLDHIDPWPLGRTAPDNLICLCTHHHRLKTHTRWQPHLHPDGTVTWTDPFKQTYQTHPANHLQTYVA